MTSRGRPLPRCCMFCFNMVQRRALADLLTNPCQHLVGLRCHAHRYLEALMQARCRCQLWEALWPGLAWHRPRSYLVGPQPHACEAVDPGGLQPRHLPQCPAKPSDIKMWRLPCRRVNQAMPGRQPSQPALHWSHFLRPCWVVSASRHKIRSMQSAMLVLYSLTVDYFVFLNARFKQPWAQLQPVTSILARLSLKLLSQKSTSLFQRRVWVCETIIC